MLKSLDEIVECAQAQASPDVAIDVSEQLGEAPGEVWFTFREPGAAELFQAAKTGSKLQAKYPQMTSELASTVAIMALSHVSPVPKEPVAVLYANLAMKNGRLFLWLMSEFLKKFPHLQNMEADVQAAKKP